MQPRDRRPFGFKGKGFIYCQLCRGELVKVVHDGVLGGCIHRYLPEHTPLPDLLRLGILMMMMMPVMVMMMMMMLMLMMMMVID